MPKRFIYLIRNGHYETDDRTAGGSLSSIGRQQARLTQQALKHFPVQVVHCSPYPQVIETAETISRAYTNAPVKQTDILKQYVGADMLNDTLSKENVIDALANQKQQLGMAYGRFFQPVEEADRHEIIVCHANIIRDLICLALGVRPESWAHMIIHHCGISSVSIAEDGTSELLDYNNVNHLPDALQTETS